MKWHVQHNREKAAAPFLDLVRLLGWSYTRGMVSGYSFAMRRRHMDARMFFWWTCPTGGSSRQKTRFPILFFGKGPALDGRMCCDFVLEG